MTGIRIRPATDADLDDMVRLTWEVAAEGRWLGTEIPFDRDERRERLAAMIAGPSSTVLAADAGPDGPAVVGHISVVVARYGVADIGMLLDAGWRGRGIGRALIDSAMSWAAGAGAHKMALEVWPDNEAALRLYRAAGFEEEGRKRGHYRRSNGEIWDAILMGRRLG